MLALFLVSSESLVFVFNERLTGFEELLRLDDTFLHSTSSSASWISPSSRSSSVASSVIDVSFLTIVSKLTKNSLLVDFSLPHDFSLLDLVLSSSLFFELQSPSSLFAFEFHRSDFICNNSNSS